MAAEKLGVRNSVFDKLVRDTGPSESGQGRTLELPEPEPWEKPVDGAALIAELERKIRRYVVVTANAAFAAGLWVLHKYCIHTAVMPSRARRGRQLRGRKKGAGRPPCWPSSRDCSVC